MQVPLFSSGRSHLPRVKYSACHLLHSQTQKSWSVPIETGASHKGGKGGQFQQIKNSHSCLLRRSGLVHAPLRPEFHRRVHLHDDARRHDRHYLPLLDVASQIKAQKVPVRWQFLGVRGHRGRRSHCYGLCGGVNQRCACCKYGDIQALQFAGYLMLIGSLFCSGFQFTYEQTLFNRYHIDPLQMVGF